MSALSQRSVLALLTVVALVVTVSILALESLVSGPPFLAIYLGLIAILWATLRVLGRQTEPAEVPAGQWSDPYLLAYLAGGPDLALRTAALSLVDRGLLRADGSMLAVAVPGAEGLVQRPIERRLLQGVGAPRDARSVFQSGTVHGGCEDIQRQLEQAGLIEDVTRRWGFPLLRATIAAGALLVVTVGRIAFAAFRGQHKVELLIALTVVGIVIVFSTPRAGSSLFTRSARTRAGETLLADMRTLFQTLPQRAGQIRPGGSTSELAFLVALYGLTAAPAFAAPTLQSWMAPPHIGPSGMASADSSASDSGPSGSDGPDRSFGSGSSCSSCGGGGGCGGCGS